MSVYGEIYRDATAAHAQPLHLQKFAPDDRAHEMAVRKLRKTAEAQRTVRARFIMDDRTLICHKGSCERCKNIPFKNRIYLSSFQRNPQISLCTNCFSATPDELELSQYISRTENMKKAMFQDAIVAYARKLGLEVSFLDADTAHVKSIEGEWRFNYRKRPIQLYHKNNFEPLDENGEEAYHLQDILMYTPAHTLSYIAIHDQPERTLPLANEMQKKMMTGRNKKHFKQRRRPVAR